MDKNDVVILLVEDDPDDQFLFKDVLSHLDPEIKLHIVSGTHKAMEFMETTIPTLVFLDINMPGPSGKECLQRIKENLRYKSVKTVMYTTSSSEQDIDDCYEKGADIYVIKPLSMAEQSKILKKIMFLHLADQIAPPSKQDFIFSIYV